MILSGAFLAAWTAAAIPSQAGSQIGRVDGPVEVFLPVLGQWKRVEEVPYGLRPGDQLRLKPLAKVSIELEEGPVLEISEGASLLFEQDDGLEAALRLDSGILEATVPPSERRVVVIKTPAGDCRMRGGRVRIRVDKSRKMAVEVLEGAAYLLPARGEPVELQKGFVVEASPDRPPERPVSVQETWRVQQKDAAGPRRLAPRGKLRRDEATPEVAAPVLKAPRRGPVSKEPELGPSALGLHPGETAAGEQAGKAPKQATQKPIIAGDDAPLKDFVPEAPELGPQALGLEPRGEMPSAPERREELGPASLGLAEPGPEATIRRAPRKPAAPAAAPSSRTAAPPSAAQPPAKESAAPAPERKPPAGHSRKGRRGPKARAAEIDLSPSLE